MPKIVDHHDRRDTLAQAAAGVIAARGLSGASLRDVAAAGGFTTGALTHYFPDRSALLAAAYDRVMARLTDRLAEPQALPADAKALAQMLAGFLPHDAETVAEWRVWLAFSAEAMVDPALAARHRDHYSAQISCIAAMMGFGRPLEADLLVALIDGLAIRVLLEPQDWPPDRIITTLTAALPAVFGDLS